MALVLVGCAAPPTSLIPPALPLPPSTAGGASGGAAAAGAERASLRVEPLPVAPEPPAPPPAGPVLRPPAATAPSGEPLLVNLEQVGLATFAQLVYADMLKRNVSVDPQVVARKDLVTFRSGATQSADAIENAARQLLKSYGVAVIDTGGLVRVVPDSPTAGSLPEIRRGAALPDTPLPLRPVFHLIELQAVRQTEVAGWLRTLFGDRVRTTEDAVRNALLISATPDTMSAVLDAIRVLDTPVLSGVQSASLTPVHWTADELARRLFDVLTAQGYQVQPLNQAPGGVRYPIILLPVPALNAVYVFARGEAVLAHVTSWARTLDRPAERNIGRGFVTYTARNTDASVLAATLEQLITGARSTAASRPAGAAPAAPAAATPSTRSGGVVVDRATNTLIFQVAPEEQSQIVALLQSLDRPTRAALIEVTVAELSIDNNDQLGLEWFDRQVGVGGGGSATAGTLGGLALGSAGFNFRVFDGSGGLRLALNALASTNKATILSSPRVLARNGETATIQVGQEVPIITSQQTTNTTGANGAANVLQTVQYRNTGVILKVKPVIHSADQIDLDVAQEVSAAAATNTGVNTSPTFSTRKVDTKLTLRNGSTVMLGGLISEDNSDSNAGVPGLRDVPVLGWLFKNQGAKATRRELIILITPYVLNDDHDARTVTDAFRGILSPWAQPQNALPATGTTPAPR
jgi:general secretion pathway protein D